MGLAPYQAIAKARLGEQIDGAGRVRFQLTAQLLDEGSQVLRLLAILRTPDLLQELAVGHDFAGVGRQAP